MDNIICIFGLFQCALECFDQMMRKLMDKSNRICEKNLLSVLQI